MKLRRNILLGLVGLLTGPFLFCVEVKAIDYSINGRLELESIIQEEFNNRYSLLQEIKDQEYTQLKFEKIAREVISEKQKLEAFKLSDPVTYAARKMAQNTGVSEAQWRKVIIKESSGNPNCISASGTYIGLFQIGRPWGAYPGMSIDEQIAMATHVYKVQGPGAWQVWNW